MKTSRIARLERLARERPCPACGRVRAAHDPAAPVPDWDRLTTEEQGELERFIRASMPAPCARCGRGDHDLTRMTDDQLERALHLLRTVMGRPRTEHERC